MIKEKIQANILVSDHENYVFLDKIIANNNLGSENQLTSLGENVSDIHFDAHKFISNKTFIVAEVNLFLMGLLSIMLPLLTKENSF